MMAKVRANFHPAKFSTERLMKTAANPVPKKKTNKETKI